MARPSDYPVRVKWVNKLQFLASDDSNHAVVIDTTKDGGGEDLGISPMRLLLCSLGGCTGMDIVDILRKQRQKLTSLQVLLRGARNKDFPHYYTHIEMHYLLEGENLSEKAVQRAIKLSSEKYCSVEATLSRRTRITSNYEITNR